MSGTPTKYVRPGPFVVGYSRVLTWLARRGISVGETQILTVRGRITGAPCSTPVHPFEVAGSRYLVGALGTSHWVRNLRASGEGQLSRGRTTVSFTAREISDGDKLPVLRSYVRTWWREVKGYFSLPEHPTDSEIRAIAHLHPVFVIVDKVD